MSATDSQFDAAAIDAIVREVVRQIKNITQPCNAEPVPEADSGTLECTNKVIALATLRGKLENVKTLRVRPKTIVTHAVRDELRDRDITLVFDLGLNGTNGSNKTIFLGTNSPTLGPGLTNQLTSLGAQVQLITDTCVDQLATKIATSISTTDSALIVTDRPYSAACTANRAKSVQAVVVRDDAEMSAAKSEMNPNCVVLNSQNVGQMNLPAILHQLQ